MNNGTWIGNFVADPELKYFKSGTANCSGCIAVKRNYAKEGYQDTDFLNIKAIGKNAENIAKYFSKGSEIAIKGAYQKDQYEKDGERKTYDYIQVEGWNFTRGSKSNKNNKSDDFSTTGQDDFQAVEDDDDIPF